MHPWFPSRHFVIALAFAAMASVLAGCATPSDAGAQRVDVSSSYNAALTSPGDVEEGPGAGSAASGAFVLVHVVPDADWIRYREFVDSGLADFVAPPSAQAGELLAFAEDGGAARYQLTLDALGQTDFRVHEGAWVRLEMSGGRAPGAECQARYRGGVPVDARVDGALQLVVPFGVACQESA